MLLVLLLVGNLLAEKKETNIYQVVRLTPPTLNKDEALTFDKTNIWHIEAFVGSVRHTDRIIEKKERF